MTTPNLHPAPAHVPHPLGHHTWWGWLGLFLVAGLVIAIVVLSWPMQTATVAPGAGLPMMDAASADSVLNYIRVHELVKPVTVVDPAAQSTLNYIRAHEAVRAIAAADPADQSVMNYVQAHESLLPDAVVPLDPNTRAVFDYLRAHGFGR